MSKKVPLLISLLSTLVLFLGSLVMTAYMLYLTYKAYTTEDDGLARAIGLVFTITFGVITIALLVSLILKIVGVKVQNNILTFVNLLLDAGLVALIYSGYGNHVTFGEIVIIALPILATVCDIISLPLSAD